MASIAVRTDPSPAAHVVRARRDTEPSRMLRALYRWDPFREMEPFFALADEELPVFDVKETPAAVHFHAELPGVKEDDVSIEVNGSCITICVRSTSASFTLPDGADTQNARADLRDAVLSVTVPKAKS
jgi:HSP20 family protein